MEQITIVQNCELAVAVTKDKAIEAYKRNCRRYQVECLEGESQPCMANCEYLADFIAELNK